MLELLRENEIGPRFSKLKSRAAKVVIAVPFWGEGAIETLNLKRGKRVRVLCNLRSGACNPYVIERLMRIGHHVKTHAKLHAKIYATSGACIVGSSNASTNGLADEGRQIQGWVEANVLSDDTDLLHEALALFEGLWTAAAAKRITPKMLREAKERWKRQPQGLASRLPRTLLAACRATPEVFKDVFVITYDQSASPKADAIADAFRKKAKKGTVDGVRLDFGSSWTYQFGRYVKPGMKLVDIDCMTKRPVFRGCAWATTPLKVPGEQSVTMAPRMSIRINGTQYRIAKAEKTALTSIARRILNGSRNPLPLADAVTMLDRVRRRRRPKR
jgi:hypothetical protein